MDVRGTCKAMWNKVYEHAGHWIRAAVNDDSKLISGVTNIDFMHALACYEVTIYYMSNQWSR